MGTSSIKFTYLLIFQHLLKHNTAMHLFLYQSARHSDTTWGNRYRYKQGTIRGDFDLELLKNGIKGRFKILPHGEHEFQQALVNIDLQEEFYGHIVRIEDKKNAVWFKLNYDQVGKHVTKYMGGWNDLKAEDIVSPVKEYQRLKKEYDEARGVLSNVRYQYSRVSEWVNHRSLTDPRLQMSKETGKIHADELNRAFVSLTRDVDDIQALMAGQQQVVRDYMKSRKL
jgi:hypothetical protein